MSTQAQASQVRDDEVNATLEKVAAYQYGSGALAAARVLGVSQEKVAQVLPSMIGIRKVATDRRIEAANDILRLASDLQQAKEAARQGAAA